MGYVPIISNLLQRLKPYLYPSIVGTYHDRPLPHLLGNVPTIGQTGYIATSTILNIVFLAVGYKTSWPKQENQWYKTRYEELMAYFMWRTGVLAFGNMPVPFLSSSRNNILLWLTNWSHSTYLLLHQWIARLFLLQTLLHSILALVLYQHTGSYATSLKTGWWIWGCVATAAAVILVLSSVLVFRQRAYELFLITHVVMAVIVVVGCWYHVYIGYENTFGYETWLYATIAVWFFDRLARVGRMLRTGLRKATVTDIGSTVVRVNIPWIRWTAPGHCVYVYFPTLSPLRPWENHPFSMIPTAYLSKPRYNDHAGSDKSTEDLEKSQHAIAVGPAESNRPFTNSGLTLFIRKSKGMTGYLKSSANLPTLHDGPYPTKPTKAALQSDRLLLIGGGIGITGLLPFLWYHPNVKLYHSVKISDQCLIDSLHSVLDECREKEIVVGKRLNIPVLLRAEADMGWSKIAVIVCGPAGMCDDVRAAVARIGKEKAGFCDFELEVDAFSR
jgi:predicted ferric reductase